MDFEKRINELKKSPEGMEGFGSEEARDLQRAIDILTTLRVQASGQGGSQVAWDKLENAKRYIEKLMKEHLEQEKS